MKNKKHTSKNLEDHIVAEAKIKEVGAKNAPVKDIDWDVKQGEIEATTDFLDDKGEGQAVIIRTFDFKLNPEIYKQGAPSKQHLFNAHVKQLEMLIMTDGLKFYTEVQPQVKYSKNQQYYRIVVAAVPMKGMRLDQKPQTLMQIANPHVAS